MKFRGTVKEIRRTNSGLKYTIIEIRNKVDLNYKLFVPTDEFAISQEVTIDIEVATPFKKEKPVKTAPVIGVGTTVDVEVPKQ